MSASSDLELVAPASYFDRNFKLDAVKILPGEYYVTTRDMLVVTVLGSCVAVCLRDRDNGIGGMNHFMLPGRGDTSDPLSQSSRYGAYAMELLLNQVLKAGGARSRLEAKVFGGGSVLAGFYTIDIGRRNTEFALDYLAAEGIPVVAQDLLGNYPRKVYFFPRSGRVLMKKLLSQHNDTILNRELAYGERLSGQDFGGDIEWFS